MTILHLYKERRSRKFQLTEVIAGEVAPFSPEQITGPKQIVHNLCNAQFCQNVSMWQ